VVAGADRSAPGLLDTTLVLVALRLLPVRQVPVADLLPALAVAPALAYVVAVIRT
jgi:uncharacterized membrane protein YqgA involved in biofilm formation